MNVRHESISRQHAALVHTETESFIQVPISALISALISDLISALISALIEDLGSASGT